MVPTLLLVVLVACPRVCIAARSSSDDTLRIRRLVWGADSNDTSTTQTFTRTNTDGVPTTTTPAINYEEFYDQFPNSAINMAGQSYYVNYDRPVGTLLEVAELCYTDKTCVSFDFADEQGWLHRVGRQCASAASAEFMDGTSGGSVFWQLKDAVLLERGINVTECNHVRGSYEQDLQTQNMVSRVFAAALGTLVLALVLLFAGYRFMRYREREDMIARIINQNAAIHDDELRGQHVDEVVHNVDGNHENDRLVVNRGFDERAPVDNDDAAND